MPSTPRCCTLFRAQKTILGRHCVSVIASSGLGVQFNGLVQSFYILPSTVLGIKTHDTECTLEELTHQGRDGSNSYLTLTTVVSPTVVSAPNCTPVLDIHDIHWSSQAHTSSFQFFYSLHPFHLCSITTWLNDALGQPKNLFKFFCNNLLKTQTDILASIIFPTTHLSFIS